jgi:acyl carrier protein
MTRPFEINENDIRDIVAQFAGRPAPEIRPQDDFETALGLDSIDRLNLLAAVEDRLDVRLDEARIGALSNLEELLHELDQVSKEVPS